MRSRPLLSFFLLAFAITWSIGAVAVFASDWFTQHFGQLDASNPLFFVAVYAPSLLSITLTAIFEGRPGLKALLARLDPRRCHPIWYLVVIVGFLLVSAAAGWTATLFGGPTPTPNLAGAAGVLATSLLLDPGPIGEELGWRGFALPRMLGRFGPVSASLLLGAIWGIWHLPSFYISTLSQSQLSLPLFLVGAVALSVVIGWLFLKSKGSVLIAMLAHLMANHASDIVGASFNRLMYGMMVVAALLIFTGQLRPEPAAEHQPIS